MNRLASRTLGAILVCGVLAAPAAPAVADPAGDPAPAREAGRLAAAERAAAPGGSVPVTGALPVRPGARITVQRFDVTSGRWLAHRTLRADADGRFRGRVDVSHAPHQVRYRAVAEVDRASGQVRLTTPVAGVRVRRALAGAGARTLVPGASRDLVAVCSARMRTHTGISADSRVGDLVAAYGASLRPIRRQAGDRVLRAYGLFADQGSLVFTVRTGPRGVIRDDSPLRGVIVSDATTPAELTSATLGRC